MLSAEVWGNVAKFTGILGIGLIIFWLLANTIFSKLTFARLKASQGFILAIMTLGLGAVLVVVAFVAWIISLYAPTKETNLGVSLHHNGSILRERFSVRYLIPGRKSAVEDGVDGVASIAGVPFSLATLDVKWV